MQENDALRTVECLRGRLQAERAASRAAEHNAQLMSNKLKELEEQLKIEAKWRRKAEKKLNRLKKKLESLNIPLNVIITEEIEQSISSNNSDISCISSIASEFQLGSKSNSITSEIAEETESDSNKCEIIADVHPVSESDSASCEPQQTDEKCHGFQQSSAWHKKSKDAINEEGQQDDEHNNIDVDNSMALVPMTSIVELNDSSNVSLDDQNENVRQVLDNLKKIRENIQSSLSRTRIIRVG
ncbi:unnamed protein product [Amaranthus hypochondriacus]